MHGYGRQIWGGALRQLGFEVKQELRQVVSTPRAALPVPYFLRVSRGRNDRTSLRFWIVHRTVLTRSYQPAILSVQRLITPLEGEIKGS
ncbi:unnamed protein product [Urochloa humidicola]